MAVVGWLGDLCVSVRWVGVCGVRVVLGGWRGRGGGGGRTRDWQRERGGVSSCAGRCTKRRPTRRHSSYTSVHPTYCEQRGRLHRLTSRRYVVLCHSLTVPSSLPCRRGVGGGWAAQPGARVRGAAVSWEPWVAAGNASPHDAVQPGMGHGVAPMPISNVCVEFCQ